MTGGISAQARTEVLGTLRERLGTILAGGEGPLYVHIHIPDPLEWI